MLQIHGRHIALSFRESILIERQRKRQLKISRKPQNCFSSRQMIHQTMMFLRNQKYCRWLYKCQCDYLQSKLLLSLKDNDFVLTGQECSHQKWHNPLTGATTVVPCHGNNKIPIGTIYSIIRASKLDKSFLGF